MKLGLVPTSDASVAELVADARAALDRTLSEPAQLRVGVVREKALVLGAFQRWAGSSDDRPRLQRASGGPEVVVGPGSIHVALALAEPGVLTPCDPMRIVNRYVRPLLRALSKSVGPAHFFGRDWVSVAHRPVAWAGFAHDSHTRRTLFEAFVAVRTPFALAQRASFLGKPQATLEAIGGHPIDAQRLAQAIADAYPAAYGAQPVGIDASACAASTALNVDTEPAAGALENPVADPPWAATCEEAIGTLGAGPDARGVFRVGGDLLVSRDALAELERDVATAEDADVGRIVDATLRRPGVALDGVRSLGSIAEVILRARSSGMLRG
jgi:hypothetical protein